MSYNIMTQQTFRKIYFCDFSFFINHVHVHCHYRMLEHAYPCVTIPSTLSVHNARTCAFSTQLYYMYIHCHYRMPIYGHRQRHWFPWQHRHNRPDCTAAVRGRIRAVMCQLHVSGQRHMGARQDGMWYSCSLLTIVSSWFIYD